MLGNCEHVCSAWQKGLADEIKDIEVSRFLWIIQIGPMESHGSLQERDRRFRVREKFEYAIMMALKEGRGHEQRKAGRTQKADSPLEHPEGTQPLDTFNLGS